MMLMLDLCYGTSYTDFVLAFNTVYNELWIFVEN